MVRLKPIDGPICYVVGAGFSRASTWKLPLDRGFFEYDAEVFVLDKLGAPARVSSREVRAFAELLSILEDEYGELIAVSLEQVLTDLHVRAFGIGRAWSSRVSYRLNVCADPTGRPFEANGLSERSGTIDFAAMYARTLEYVCRRLLVPEVLPHACEFVKRFVEAWQPSDSVISLNYDILLERNDAPRPVCTALPRVVSSGQLSVRYQHYDAAEIRKFVKLHGSVNWRVCPNSGCPNYHVIEIFEPSDRSVVRPRDVLRCTSCGEIPVPVLLPPVAAKPFEQFPKMKLMWLEAYNSFIVAARWVFVGVSFERTDYHFASLVRAASRDALRLGNDPFQIVIVNPDCNVRDQVVDALAPRMQAAAKSDSSFLVRFDELGEYLDEAAIIDAGRPQALLDEESVRAAQAWLQRAPDE